MNEPLLAELVRAIGIATLLGTALQNDHSEGATYPLVCTKFKIITLHACTACFYR